MGTEMLHEQINEQERQERQEPNQPPRRRVRALRWVGARLREAPIPLLAGLLGSLAAIVVMGVLRLTVGTPTLPELLAERILLLLPASTFVDLLVRFQPNSKTAPLGLTLLGQFVIGILLGPLFALISGDSRGKRGFWPGRRAWLTAGIAVVVMEGVGLALFWPVLDAGLAGDSPDRARLLTSLAMLATFLAFVLVLLFANHWLHRAWAPQPRALAPAEPVQPTQPEQVTASDERAISRRAALGAAGVVVLAVAAGGLGIDRLIASYFARSNLAYEGMSNFDLAPITPNEHFYIVSKNVLDPQVDISCWQLEVKGLVNHPTTWHYDQLRALPAETRVVTFECIANNVGGHLISTAEWQGVLLQTVLDKAGGVQASGKYITFTSVDGYQYSLPLADLLEARTLLAWQMNGVPLPERHGYPLRAVVPGRYGEQSPKWLTRIEVVDQLYTGGLYQSQGWASTQVPTTGRINQPAGKVPRGAITVAGIAFAGIRGIQKVEVSADKGMNWHTATLTPPLSDQSWVFWQWPWTPSAPGTYTLLMRATDGTGALQTQTQRGTVPSGATGWPQVTVQIV